MSPEDDIKALKALPVFLVESRPPISPSTSNPLPRFELPTPPQSRVIKGTVIILRLRDSTRQPFKYQLHAVTKETTLI